jgi:hypothetical protein
MPSGQREDIERQSMMHGDHGGVHFTMKKVYFSSSNFVSSSLLVLKLLFGSK